MGKTWPRTKEQQEFLDAKMSQYVVARLRHAKAVFVADVQNEWFKRWPERDVLFGENSVNLTAKQEQQVAEAKKRRKDQLRTYIRWHGDRYRNARRQLLRKRLASYLNTRKKKMRRKTLPEVYSSMYWDTRIAPVVEAAMEKTKPLERESFKAYHSRRIRTMITARDTMWKKEDPDTVQQVKAEKARRDAEQEKEEGEVKGTENEDGEGGGDEQTLEDLREDIENIIPVLRAVGKKIHDRTGFFITFLVGGMSVQGKIECHSMHCGTTTAGHTWPESMIGFKKKIGIPWTQFIHSAITPDMQRDRADFHLRQSTGAAPSTQFLSMHDKALPTMGLYQMEVEKEEEELRKEMGVNGSTEGSATATQGSSKDSSSKSRSKPKKKKSAADMSVEAVVGALQKLASTGGLDPKATSTTSAGNSSSSLVQPSAEQTSSPLPNPPVQSAPNLNIRSGVEGDSRQPGDPPAQGGNGDIAMGSSLDSPRGVLQQLMDEVDQGQDNTLDALLFRRNNRDGGASDIPMPAEDTQITGSPERFLPPVRDEEEDEATAEDDSAEVPPLSAESLNLTGGRPTRRQTGQGRKATTSKAAEKEGGKTSARRGRKAKEQPAPTVPTEPTVDNDGNDGGDGEQVLGRRKRKARAANDWEAKMEALEKKAQEERAKKRACK